MSKVYVFGIGGTGSRVLRSLTMLLASGVECAADTIVPIIIDPDAAGGDVERTATLMRHYTEVRNRLNFSSDFKNKFFRTEIKKIMPNYHLPLANTEDCLFEEFIDFTGMTRENQALASLLFSKKNLNSDMKVGFKGNPNVGSVVLNQFDKSEEFNNFANEFTAEDKIFIISSIFGGTGASGFPLLLKTLRESDSIVNQGLVNNANIGAITVLPYFKVKQDENSAIDSATFVSKAKSALAYYNRTISRLNAVDYLYYIGDDTRSTTYDNCEGGTNQKNNAHFIELASALAIIDFANQDKPESTVHKEFGIQEDTNEIIFEELGNTTKRQIRASMTQFELFAKYMDETDDYLRRPWAKDRQFNQTFFDGDFVKVLKRDILQNYLSWISELSTQDRAFLPFEIHRDSKRVFDLVKGVKQRSLMTLDSNYDLYNKFLDKYSEKIKNGDKSQQFMELFYEATKNLVKEKFNIE